MKIDGKEFYLMRDSKSKVKAKMIAQKYRLKGKHARVKKMVVEDTKQIRWGVFIHPLGRKIK